MKRIIDDWCSSLQRTVQKTEECLGQASSTEIALDLKRQLDELDVLNIRNNRILDTGELMLKRNPHINSQDFIYQTKEKTRGMRTNALIQLGGELTFAGRHLGENTLYGKCLMLVGKCQDRLGNEELYFVTDVAAGFLTPVKRYIESSVGTALKERRALKISRLDLDAARNRLKKCKTAEKQALAEATFRERQAQYERQMELTRQCCEAADRDKASQLRALLRLVDAQVDYYRKSADIALEVRAELAALIDDDRDPLRRTSGRLQTLAITNSATQTKSYTAPVEPNILLPPATPVKARIKDPFAGNTASEATVAANEIVFLVESTSPTKREQNGWSLIRKASGQVGYVPRECLEVLDGETVPPFRESRRTLDAMAGDRNMSKLNARSSRHTESRISHKSDAAADTKMGIENTIPSGTNHSSEMSSYHFTTKCSMVLQNRSHVLPCPRSGHRLVADSEYLYSYGGYRPTRNPRLPGFTELWRFSLRNRSWKLISDDGPIECASHSMALVNGCIVLWGGTCYPWGARMSQSLHVFHISTRKWTKLACSGRLPLQRYGQGMVFHNDQMYVIGGTCGTLFLRDVYRLDLSSLRWDEVVSKEEISCGYKPEGRYRHECTLYQNRIYIFGGTAGEVTYGLQKLPVFDLASNAWKVQETLPDPVSKRYPEPRRFFGSCRWKNVMLICGGVSDDRSMPFNDIWLLELSTMEWRQLPQTLPIPVFFHAVAVTPEGCAYIFGGVKARPKEQRTNALMKVWLTVPPLSAIVQECLSDNFAKTTSSLSVPSRPVSAGASVAS